MCRHVAYGKLKTCLLILHFTTSLYIPNIKFNFDRKKKWYWFVSYFTQTCPSSLTHRPKIQSFRSLLATTIWLLSCRLSVGYLHIKPVNKSMIGLTLFSLIYTLNLLIYGKYKPKCFLIWDVCGKDAFGGCSVNHPQFLSPIWESFQLLVWCCQLLQVLRYRHWKWHFWDCRGRIPSRKRICGQRME
jgi:hypothetical protein